uniref:DUF19 domain-containing protein n=1 Tax=Caenorhabditis tropicalis TaxID=1561998 RepID=A0A1I7V2A5_9PELO
MKFLLCLLLCPMAVFGGSFEDMINGSNCTAADIHSALVCGMESHEFTEKVMNYTGKDEVKSLKDSCDDIKACSLSYGHCAPFQFDRVNKVSSTVKIYCHLIKFLTKEFADCQKKLKESECYSNWSPFKNMKGIYTDEKACMNFYGSENCLKKEITKTCSEGDWKKLHNKMLALNNLVKQCVII